MVETAGNAAACVDTDVIAFEIPPKCEFNDGPDAINPAGTLLAGDCFGDGSETYYTYPVIHVVGDGSTIHLGFLPDAPPETFSGYAFDVNDSGQAVGMFCDFDSCLAFIWEDGLLSEIENPFGFESADARAINDRGLVAGNVEWTGGYDAMSYDTHTGIMTILGDGLALEMNDTGHVVGINIIDLAAIHVILYRDGNAIDLANNFPPSWFITNVEGINNYGWIVGDATTNFNMGRKIGWLLVPIYSKGDYDGDEDVDLQDFGKFQECFAAEAYQGPEGGLHVGCSVFDFDDDIDLDLTDYAAFQAALTGPTAPDLNPTGPG